MCASCDWYRLSLRIDAYLETVAISHRALILDKAREMIVANQHATPEQVDAIETVLEQQPGADLTASQRRDVRIATRMRPSAGIRR